MCKAIIIAIHKGCGAYRFALRRICISLPMPANHLDKAASRDHRDHHR